MVQYHYFWKGFKNRMSLDHRLHVMSEVVEVKAAFIFYITVPAALEVPEPTVSLLSAQEVDPALS